MTSLPPEPVQYATTSDGLVIVRVFGKGTHLQSPSLRYIFEKTRRNNPPPRYIIDMNQCTTLDSTFMGMMASIALHQRKTVGTPAIAVNVQDHVRFLMETLGLQFILEIRARRGDGAQHADGSFKPAEAPNLSPAQKLVMMIEAHETLINADQGNEIKFEGVLKSLRESLDRARQDGEP